MCSVEPGEDWGWCYLDRTTLEPMADDDRRAEARARQVEAPAL